MANSKVNLLWRCKTPAGWRRYPALFGKTGRVRPGWVKVSGAEIEYPEGRFELRYYDGRRQIFEDAGQNGFEAQAKRDRMANKLTAKAAAASAGFQVSDPTTKNSRKSLRGQLRDFLDSASARGKMEAKIVYEAAATDFLDLTGRLYADELKREDVTRWLKELRERGLEDRTISNRWGSLKAFFIFLGFNNDERKTLLGARPSFEEKLPEIYSPEELAAFFATEMSDKHRVAFSLMLQCGLREREAMHLEWGSVDLKRNILRVRKNPRHGFRVKDAEQRDIPIPAGLVEQLKDLRKAYPEDLLVVGIGSDHPEGHFLRHLLAVVKRANLSGRWFLHKYRATYITNLLRAGVDLRTVQHFAGHSDLASTSRYLSPADNESTRGKINSIRWS